MAQQQLVTRRLTGPLFEGSRDLDVDRLQRLLIQGRSEIPTKLVNEEEIVEASYNPYVTTTIRINSDGEVLESYLDVGQMDQGKKQKFPADRVFSACKEKETKVILGKLDLSSFNFPPSSNHSEWKNASDFGLVFQRGNNKTAGTYPAAEWPTQGLSDFAMKLVVQVTEDPGLALGRVVALPLPVERLGELPGGNAKTEPGYPAIDLFSRSSDLLMLPQNHETIREDSLPVLPLLLYQGAPGTEPTTLDTGKVFRAMYAVWSNVTGVRGCTSTRFGELTSATPMVISPVPPSWAWPLLEPDIEPEVTLGKSNVTMLCTNYQVRVMV